jgi:pimeloyl-ACP methyl ester carboxylesterase
MACMNRVPAASLFALGVLAGAAAHPDNQPNTHQYYDVEDAKLYTETFGQGTPVLFLHGGLLFFDNNFIKQLDYFAANHTVIGIDQRGHGHSPDGPWELSYQLMADDTAVILKQMHAGRVDVVGHSDGADIALILARDHPELVRRVVISGANLRGLPAEVLDAHRRWSPAQLDEKVRSVAAALPPYFQTDYGAASPDGPGHWLAMVTKCYWLWSQSVVINPNDLKEIAAPVLVIAGDHDFTSIEESTEIFRDLPHAQLLIVPGTGHGTFQNRPELVNLAITEFLDRADGGA